MMAEPFQRLDEIRPTRHNLYDGSGYVDPPLRAGRSRTGRRPCPQSGPLWWPPNSEPAYRRSKLGQFEVGTRTTLRTCGCPDATVFPSTVLPCHKARFSSRVTGQQTPLSSCLSADKIHRSKSPAL